MAIRLSGMVSGLDTDAIVKGLSSAYQVKIDNVTKKKKKAEWQMDAWSTLNTKIYSLYTGTLTKMKTYGNYKTKKASVAGGKNGAATVSADSKAAEGTYKMKIKSTATAAFLTSAKLSGNTFTATYDAANATTFKQMYDGDSEIGVTGKSIKISYDYYTQSKNGAGQKLYTLSNGGAAVEFEQYDVDGAVIGHTTEATQAQINAYLSSHAGDEGFDRNAYKVEAAMTDRHTSNDLDSDETNNSFTYTFTDASSVADINNKLSEAGITGISATMSDGKLSFVNTAGFTVNDDGTIDQKYGSYNISSSDGALSALGFGSDSISADITQTPTTTTSESGESHTTYTTNNKTTSDTKFSYKVADSNLTVKSRMSDYLKDLFATADSETVSNSDGSTTTKKYIDYKIQVGSGAATTVKIYEDQTVNDVCKAIGTATGDKVSANFDATNQRFFLSSKATGESNNFTITAGDTAGSTDALQRLGLIADPAVTDEAIKMSKQDAKDCVIELNGATLTSASNSVKVDSLGLTINVEAAPSVNSDDDLTNDEEMTITVGKDTDSVYNMVKDFIKEYNELVKSMSDLYYADATKYEPLTDEEEAEMTDTQIDKWETKAKSALLRRDDRLSTVMSTMRTELAGSVNLTKDDGTQGRFSLSAWGIVTGDWDEYGQLHIQGDADDAEYSSKTNKLKAGIEDNPELVMNTLAGLSQNLYTKVGKMMRSTTLSSTQKIYNDKSMKSQISDYDDEIDSLNDKLTTIQDKYYKQFSAMEVALSKLQSTASSLGFSTGSTTA